MKTFKSLSLAAAVAVVGFTAAAPQAQAQIEPMCPYGYYDYAPYSCAPYGYYGPEWFTGGVFLGAGPWLHDHDRFRGEEDHRFDASRGEGRGPGAMEDHRGGFEAGHEGGFEGGHEGGGHEGGGHGGGGGGHR